VNLRQTLFRPHAIPAVGRFIVKKAYCAAGDGNFLTYTPIKGDQNIHQATNGIRHFDESIKQI
jgi:hypothetical protein